METMIGSSLNDDGTVKSNSIEECHYGGTIQPLEFMQATMSKEEFVGFLKGNVLKYVSRAGKKKGVSAREDLLKARRYLGWWISVLDGVVINPREGS